MERMVLWGTGNYGNQAYQQLSELKEIEIVCVCDMDSNKIGQLFHGMIVSDFAEIIDEVGYYDTLLICAKKWEDMYLIARSHNIKESHIKLWNGCAVNIDETYQIGIYSQDGEELFLRQKFAKQQKGFYVDVGAYHPIRYSNTFWAYKKGWRGINIEPNPEIMELFRRLRPEDVNINCGVSKSKGILRYYQFDEAGINTFDKERAEKLVSETEFKIIKTAEIEVVPLGDILKEHNITHIDFLDIDVEKYELDVLESIDFSRIHIDCIMVEQLDTDLYGVINSREAKYLLSYGYMPISKYNRTVIYEMKLR